MHPYIRAIPQPRSYFSLIRHYNYFPIYLFREFLKIFDVFLSLSFVRSRLFYFILSFNLQVKSKKRWRVKIRIISQRYRIWNFFFFFSFLERFEILEIISSYSFKSEQDRIQSLQFLEWHVRMQLIGFRQRHNLRLIVDRCFEYREGGGGGGSRVESYRRTANKSVANRIIPPPSSLESDPGRQGTL